MEVLFVLAAHAAVDALFFLGERFDVGVAEGAFAEAAHNLGIAGAAGVGEELLIGQAVADLALEKAVPGQAVLVRVHEHGAVKIEDNGLHR